MRRLLVRLVIVGLMVTVVAMPTAAQSGKNSPVGGGPTPTPATGGSHLHLPGGAAVATAPAATPAANHGPLDLAAMVLRPSDIKLSGAGFGLGQSQLYGLDYYSDADARAKLKTDGFQIGYLGGVYRDQPNQAIWSYINVFATPAGAADALSYWTSAVQPVSQAPKLGDRSVMISYQTTNGGKPLDVVAMNFQLGNIYAYVEFDDYTPKPPDQQTVANLGRVLLQRIQAVERGTPPNLSNAIVRLAPSAGQALDPRYDAYFRLQGDDFAVGGEKSSDKQFRLATYGKATNVYVELQGLLPGKDTNDAIYVETDLMTFSDAAAATTWLNGFIPTMGKVYPNLMIFAEPPSAPTFGDGSIVATYHLTDDDTFAQSGTTQWQDSGILVLGRVGSVAFSLQTHADSAAQLAEIEPLVRAQIACLQPGASCPAVPISPALAHASSVTAASGTPSAATPGAGS